MSSAVAVFGLGKYQKSGILELKKRKLFIVGFDENNNPHSKKIVDKFFNVVAGVTIGILTKAVKDIQLTRKVLKKKNPNPEKIILIITLK